MFNLSTKKTTFALQNQEKMAKKIDKTEDKIVAVEEALGRTEQFIENNQKTLTIIISVIIIIVLGFFGYKKFVVHPMEKEAQSQIFMAEMYFQKDSLDKALYGDGNYLGFIDIVDEYGITQTAKLANYYAGICLLKKGQFEDAISYLKDFSVNDHIIAPMALGAIGDAYSELKDFDKAASYYMNAANEDNNEFTSPTFLFKAGLTYEILKDYNNALKVYQRIQDDYKNSSEARDIEKYIARAKQIASK